MMLSVLDSPLVSTALVCITTILLGLWIISPGIGMSLSLSILRERRRTDLGALARPPALLEHVDRGDFFRFVSFLLPIGFNLWLWSGLGFRDSQSWFWPTVILAEAGAIGVMQLYRHGFFLEDAKEYLRLTEPGNISFSGRITLMTGCGDDVRPILLIYFRGEEDFSPGMGDLYYVPDSTDSRYDISSFSRTGSPVRAFFRLGTPPEAGLPPNVRGTLIGVQLLPFSNRDDSRDGFIDHRPEAYEGQLARRTLDCG